jgi:hypothetical protein
LVLPLAASAQGVPSYAQPGNTSQDETITGRVIAINDVWHITVADDRGFNDTVELHQGTIINPTGLTLAPGMSVTIEGYGNGPVFEANEIDTPYSYGGPLPVPVYYGAGWWYPGYPYGYGPSFNLFFNFGRFEQRPFAGHAFYGFRDSAYGHGYVAPRDTHYGARPANENRNTNDRNTNSNNQRSYNSTTRTTVNNYASTRSTQNYSARTSYAGSRPANAGAYTRPANTGRTSNNSHPSSSNRGSSGGGDHHR